jgi:hypothetical protein
MKVATLTKTITLTHTVDADDASVATDPINGIIRKYVLVVPALDGADTVTFYIKDADGYTLYSVALLAGATTHVVNTWGTDKNLAVPVNGAVTFAVKTSGNQSATRTFTLKAYYEQE